MTILIAFVVIVALALGASLSSWLERLRSSRQVPPRVTQIHQDAEALNAWIQKGKDNGFVSPDGKVVVNDTTTFHAWSKTAPFRDVVREETLAEGERKRLSKQFWQVFFYLILLGFLSGLAIWQTDSGHPLRLALLSGLLGSAIAAFRSLLDRRANGLEDRFGNQTPDATVPKERFGDGMISWFFGRPLLGLAVAAMVYYGVTGGVFSETAKKEITENTLRLTFYMMLAGLFAKTLLDIFLELAKKVFKA
jgi:hypothetical protein